MKTQTITEAARKVLDHFGLDENDYQKLDPLVDWEALARYIENPTKIAVCHILDVDGKIVMRNSEPIRVHEEVAVENAEEELKKNSLVFVEWWD